MKVLGIDPGTRVVGYGVLEEIKGKIIVYDFGAIVTQTKATLPTRLRQIYQRLTEIITQHQPQAVSIEKIFAGKNYQSAIRIGEGRGVALLAAAMFQIPVYEYDPTKVKKAVAGIGSAHKTQIQSMVQVILNLPQQPNPSDAADALAIALCHLHNYHLALIENENDGL